MIKFSLLPVYKGNNLDLYLKYWCLGKPEVFPTQMVFKLIAVNFRVLVVGVFLPAEGAVKGGSEDLLIDPGQNCCSSGAARATPFFFPFLSPPCFLASDAWHLAVICLRKTVWPNSI